MGGGGGWKSKTRIKKGIKIGGDMQLKIGNVLVNVRESCMFINTVYTSD